MRSAPIGRDAPAGVANPSTRSAASRPTRKPPLHTVVFPFDRSEIVAYSPLPIFRTDAKPLSTSGVSETRASSATSANDCALSVIAFLLWSIGINDYCLSNVLVGYTLLWEVRHAPTGEPG